MELPERQQEEITSILSYDALHRRPLGAGGGGFSLWFPTPCALHTPPTVIESTAGGIALVAAAQAADRDRKGGGHTGSYGYKRQT